MDGLFQYTASKLTDAELQARLDHREKYLPETVEASLTELQNRGHEFTPEELKVISEDIQAQRTNASLTRSQSAFSGGYKSNIVEDEAAPNFYSRRAVFMFTFFLGALFGAIMFAINLSKIGKYKEIWYILLFGTGFTILAVLLGNVANQGSSFGILSGIVSANIIDYFFWDRFIGNARFYHARPVWAPLAIALSILALMIWAVAAGM